MPNHSNVLRVVSASILLLSVVGEVGQAQGRGRGRGRDENAPPPQISDREQQQRIADEQRRTAEYQRHLNEQMQIQQQRAAAMQQANRANAYRAQQEYAARLAQQQAQLRAARDYAREGYITAPHTYRFRANGAYRETNQYGVDVLHQALNSGCRQGFAAGVADRQDRWRHDYANSPAYREATYGYTGSYIDLSDYSYYFRQGFQRCYDDGYYNRTRYGSLTNGTYSILGNVLNSLLQLTTLR